MMKKIEKVKANIVLDIDGVLCDFVQGMIDYSLNTKWKEHLPTSPSDITKWQFFPPEMWKELKHNRDFWLGLDTLNEAECKLEIIPAFYLTARPISTEITEQWLEKCGFPKSAVITVLEPLNKITVMKNTGKDCILIDDHVDTIRAVRREKLNAILYDAPYHCGQDIRGLTVIHTIEEINRIGRNLQ